MKIFVLIFFTLFSDLLFSVAQANQATAKPLRYAKLHGTIEKVTISDIKSTKSALKPKREKVCDIEMKVPFDSSFESNEMKQSSPCTTYLQGKSAKVYVMGRTYLGRRANDKATIKGADLILIVESPLFEVSRHYLAGAYTPNLSLNSLSLWYSTPTFETNYSSSKAGESFSVDITFDDQGK